jgi:hypothetical protein
MKTRLLLTVRCAAEKFFCLVRVLKKVRFVDYLVSPKKKKVNMSALGLILSSLSQYLS